MENLYSLVSKTVSNDTKLSKVQFGYTVDTYKGVLEALQNARIKAAQGGVISSNGGSLDVYENPVFKRWTEMTSIDIGGIVSADGFVVENGDYEKYRQQQVRILSYMPFVIDIPKDGKNTPHYVPFESYKEVLDSKGQAVSGRKSLPVINMTEETCKNVGIAVGSMNNSFEIGIAVDLSDGGTADLFFEKCYNKIYSKGCAKKLAEINALVAEVAFPHGSNADAVNIKVTVEAGICDRNAIHTIYFPIPLLLTNTFNTLGKIIVNAGEKYVTVGEGDCSYPFANSKFNHLNSSLEGFTPQYVKDIISDSSRVLETKDKVSVVYNSKTYSLGQGQGGSYIRFYIDKNKEAEAIKILGKDIPIEYLKEIFKGRREAKMGEEIIGFDESGGGFGSINDVTEFWEEIGKSLKNPLSALKVISAVNLAGKWEAGTDKKGNARWDTWEICGKGDGDGEGVSAGKFQFTQRAGGIKIWKEKLIKRGGNISSSFSSVIDSSLTGSSKGGGKKYAKLTYADASVLLGFAKEFADISATKVGQLAQCDVWKLEKGDKTIEIYNMLDCSTAAEFSAIFGAVNHHPSIKKDYTKWASLIKGKPSLDLKILAIENTHWAAIANYYYKRNETPDTINSSVIRSLSSSNGNGWANRYIDCLANYKTMG